MLPPPDEPTTTLFFMLANQWRKMRPVRQSDPTDRLIVVRLSGPGQADWRWNIDRLEAENNA
jgi:hypothetical protein